MINAIANYRTADAGEEEGRLRKASQEFEGLLLNNLLRPLERSFSSVPGDGDEDGNQNYASLGLEALAGALSSGKGFGLGQLLLTRLHEGTEAVVTRNGLIQR